MAVKQEATKACKAAAAKFRADFLRSRDLLGYFLAQNSFFW